MRDVSSDDVVIVAATRTPIGRFQGALAEVSAVDLGALVVRRLLEQTGLDGARVNEVVMGQVLTGGAGQNPARQTAIRAGLPVTVPGLTINKVCGSGLKAVQLAALSLQAGDTDIVIAGGQENMSQAPYLVDKARSGLRMGHGSLTDSMIKDGLWDAFNDYHMGMTAENLAEQYNIDREQQDAFALASQHKALQAQREGLFEDEITPVTVVRRGVATTVAVDEAPRETTLEQLQAMRPAFKSGGTVTAGNASGLNDGAAAVLLMRRATAEALGLPVLARIVAQANSGVDPSIMGIAPVDAVRRCLTRAGWTLDSVDLIEANEAFAVQSLAVGKALGWNPDRVNVNGGAIALGHPIGASGCRVLVTLLHALKKRHARRGIATLCIGGGQGVALAVEREG